MCSTVCVSNLSAKAITITPHFTLWQLKKDKVLRHVDMCHEEPEDTARISTQTLYESKPTLPEGISLEGTDLSEEDKKRATKLFSKWECVFLENFKVIAHTKLVKHNIKS